MLKKRKTKKPEPKRIQEITERPMEPGEIKVMAEEPEAVEPAEQTRPANMLDRACASLGIKREDIFAFQEYPEEQRIVIITNAGQKLFYKE